ncbi:ABC transporter substrate-binding protein [Pararhodobacter aggregans]|uniref:Thiamine pyrimidine synthase n=1 Tax=Pararhodobacter aggregans TaxID=404875 RepID=A0A2T7URP6_9RHOB|nr:ABC transporter substrate-binding protein [Pararhodobacter aggregans]PVE47261.1 nitrate ABC transporter substrate-binding protein [Pararhodobacter aggregans]
MKYGWAGLAAALGMTAGMASAQDAVTLQLKWVTQGQFAGYYVALDNGYYEEEGLDVTIRPGGPDIAPVQVLMGGGADVMVDWMPSALAAREQGAPVVNIAQPVIRSGLMLVCWADAGIATPEDFRGHKIGTWFFGNEIPLLNWLSQLGIPTTGGEDGAEILRIGFNVDPLLQRQADCVTAMTYNEYWQVIDAGVTPEQIVVFRYEDYGVATLEDGLWVNEANLSDPAFVERMARFVRASMRGWEWALANPEAAAEMVLDHDETGAQTLEHQVRMVREMAALTEGSTGVLDEAAYQRTVDTLLGGGSDPVITRAPEGAFTHAVTDAATME